MDMKGCILFMLMLSIFSKLYAQEYRVEITLSDVEMIEECHFGDEWSSYFSFGGKYRYEKFGDAFVLKPKQEFGLKSMVFEGNETHNDYEEETKVIAYEDLEIGRNTYEQQLYIEDENTGRYHCNNATFRFSYIILVSER